MRRVPLEPTFLGKVLYAGVQLVPLLQGVVLPAAAVIQRGAAWWSRASG